MSYPLRDHQVAYDYTAHRRDGYLGGDDFRTTFGERIEAPVTGRLTMAGSTASIRQHDRRRSVLLHLATLIGKHSRDVVAGEVIGTAGRLWIHAHDIAPGDPASKHSRASWLTRTNPAAPTPDPIESEETMKTIQIAARRPDGGYNRALVTPGTAYFFPWDEGANATLANALGAALDTGNAVEITQSGFDAMRAAAKRLEPAAK